MQRAFPRTGPSTALNLWDARCQPGSQYPLPSKAVFRPANDDACRDLVHRLVKHDEHSENMFYLGQFSACTSELQQEMDGDGAPITPRRPLESHMGWRNGYDTEWEWGVALACVGLLAVIVVYDLLVSKNRHGQQVSSQAKRSRSVALPHASKPDV